MAFQRAERQRVWLKMAVTGPSGSGKTYGALRMGFGLGKKIALIDTENGSGSLYADLGEYDVMEIEAPFTVAKYAAAIKDAVAAGYDVLIIDSLSHAWTGDGGLMDQKTARDARGGNSFTNWGEIGKIYEQFKTALLQSPIHIIGTMRSKQDYVIETDTRGKSTPRKVGMAPIQREGFEYEFTTVFDVDMTHTSATSKDRTGLFTDEIGQLSEDHGRRLSAWLAGGAAPTLKPAAPEPAFEDVRATRDGTPRAERVPADQRPPASNNQAPNNGGTQNSGGTPACVNCGKALTKAQNELSIRNYGEALCPGCQRNKNDARAEKPKPAASSAHPSASPDVAPKPGALTPRDEVIQILSGFPLTQRIACFDRFTHAYGTKNVKEFGGEQIQEVLAYLRDGEWPHEAAFQTAKEERERDEETDPFADDADQPELLAVAAAEPALAGKGHGDS